MNTPEVSIKDRSVQDIHLEGGFIYVIDTNLKLFAESVHVLAKISEQILLQPTADMLIMTAFNSTKSAYGKVTLAQNFFTRTEAPVDGEEQFPDGDVCRVSTLSMLNIFKNATTKSLALPSFDCCQLELNPGADIAIVHLKQEHTQIRRCYVLSMKEQHGAVCDNLTDRQRLKNKMTAQPRVLINLFSGLDCRETKLVASATQFTAHRYIIREDFSKVRKTEVTIPVDHFELYHIHVNSQIVVSLKELRSILHFADTARMAVSLHFDLPGRPVIVALEDTLEFQAEFVLATLEAEQPLALVVQPQQQLNHAQTPHHQQQEQNTPTTSAAPAAIIRRPQWRDQLKQAQRPPLEQTPSPTRAQSATTSHKLQQRLPTAPAFDDQQQQQEQGQQQDENQSPPSPRHCSSLY